MSQLYPIGARSFPSCARSSKKRITARPFSTFLLSATLLSAASASADTFSFTGEVPQVFVAPTSGIYLITAQGASGGNEQYKYYGKNSAGGKGAIETGKFALSAGTTLYITVGGVGGNGSSSFEEYGGGGGGGESVVSSGNSGMFLLIAGGGGGAGASSGKDGLSATGEAASAGGGNGGAGGINGSGGVGGTGSNDKGGGGGGLGESSPGTDGTGYVFGHGGGGPGNGKGGAYAGDGGFAGGGGGGGGEKSGGGGGAGYNGGGGGTNGYGGGAGGSLNTSTLYQDFSTAAEQGNGLVSIDEVSGSGTPPTVPEPGTFTLLGTGVLSLFASYRRSRA